jgi:hypothetical protein
MPELATVLAPAHALFVTELESAQDSFPPVYSLPVSVAIVEVSWAAVEAVPAF